jgi:hypothetical protein
MTDGVRSGWRRWLPRVGPRERRDKFWTGREAFEISVGQARDRRSRELQCNLFVVVPDRVVPDRDIMLVGADDQDAGPDAPPFADFLRVVQDEGPADFQSIWIIELIPEDPRVVLEIMVSRPVQETFLFSFQVPQFSPILERIERDRIVYLSARSTLEAALKHAAPDSAVGIPFGKPTRLRDLLRQYEEWDAAGRPR